MNRGLERRTIFRDNQDSRSFLQLVSEAAKRWNVHCHAACLMNNHYHLLLHDADGHLSRAMRHIDGVFTQRFNRRHHRDGPLLRGRFRSQVVDSENYLLEAIRYIHLNPVKARIVTRADQFGWSSHRHYLNRKQPMWLWKSVVHERFGTTQAAMQAFDAFVHERIPHNAHTPFDASGWTPIVGSNSFVEGWNERIRHHPSRLDPELPETRQLTARTVHAVILAACETFGRSERDLLTGGAGVQNQDRQLALAACRDFTKETNASLGRWFGVSAKTIATAVRRTRGNLERDAGLDRRYRQLLAAIDQMSNDAT